MNQSMAQGTAHISPRKLREKPKKYYRAISTQNDQITSEEDFVAHFCVRQSWAKTQRNTKKIENVDLLFQYRSSLIYIEACPKINVCYTPSIVV